MIIIFSTSLGIMTAMYKKRQIEYLGDLIYICEKINLMLKSTTPETQQIMRELKTDSRLEFFDFTLEKSVLPLPENETARVESLFDLIGKYDTESQIKMISEYSGHFKMLEDEYKAHYSSHCRLYLAAGLLSGVFVAVLTA